MYAVHSFSGTTLMTYRGWEWYNLFTPYLW